MVSIDSEWDVSILASINCMEYDLLLLFASLLRNFMCIKNANVKASTQNAMVAPCIVKRYDLLSCKMQLPFSLHCKTKKEIYEM